MRNNKNDIEILNSIVEESYNIDVEKISNEILDWLIKNVEQFIDNQTKIFKIDLIIDGESDPPMPETRNLQNLFRHIPDDQNMVDSSKIFKENGNIDFKKLSNKSITKATKTRTSLAEITDKCLKHIQSNEEKLKKLYERMSFYYEMIGFHKGNPLLREIKGAVNITKFEYEAFSVDVKVKSPMYQIQRESGKIDVIESQTKEYTVPEGFAIWVEIAFSSPQRSTCLF